MQLFARGLYQAWASQCAIHDAEAAYLDFLRIAAIKLRRDIDEVEQFLLTQSWCKKP